MGEQVDIPFTVGGGISSVERVHRILKNGADKVSVNSAVVYRPELAREIAEEFGVQVLVVAIDARKIDGRWLVHTHGGTKPTDLDLFEWAERMQEMGAGEILFTSMDHDGTKTGFACEALAQMNELLTIPVIASGGAGAKEHFVEVFTSGGADAGLAASIFHFDEISIPDLKGYLKEHDIPIRI